MSPRNRGPPMRLRMMPAAAGVRPLPPPRFDGRIALPPRMSPRMTSLPPISPAFGDGPIRQRPLPPPLPAGASQSNGLPFPGPRARVAPCAIPSIGAWNAGFLNAVRPWRFRRMSPLRMMPPQMIASHMMPSVRPRFPAATTGNNDNRIRNKPTSNAKKINKLEDLELKKPWMTDEIRSEIQKKNRLYAKAKKNKNTIEWEEFKDLRNKVTRLIRDAKNEYLAKHPEQGDQKIDDNNTIKPEGVQKTDNSTEQSEQTEAKEETQPSSEQAQS